MEAAFISRIQKNYQRVRDQIAEATIRSGRAEGTVQLVVVTKSQPLEVVKAAIAAGALLLGENYAEEAILKISAVADAKVDWHMIGHVQSRKAELVAGHFSMLQSLDSVKLAGKLDRTCNEMKRVMPMLLEVNVSGEESKFGFQGWDERHWVELVPIFEQIWGFPGLKLRGLMTMPPFFTDAEQTRPYFRRLRRLQEFLQKQLPQANWAELSMGTSVDFVTAIEEGATYVRVGNSILGPRAE